MSPTPEPVATPVAAIGKRRPEGGIPGISSGNLISAQLQVPNASSVATECLDNRYRDHTSSTTNPRTNKAITPPNREQIYWSTFSDFDRMMGFLLGTKRPSRN